MSGLPKDIGLIPPDQVRAGVHRGLSELAMRALANDGATASRHESPCTTPEELVKAIGEMPCIRPPEPAFTAPPDYQRTTYQQGSYGRPATPSHATQPTPVPPPPLHSRTGKALKWAVSALLIAALGLGSWQLADALMDQGGKGDDTSNTQTTNGDDKKASKPVRGKPIAISELHDFDPFGSDGSEYPENLPKVLDGDPESYWQTSYYASSDFGRLKPGVGVVVDLGKSQDVGKVTVTFIGSTSVELRAAPGNAESRPTSFDSYSKVAEGSGTTVSLAPKGTVKTRYLLVWLTELPMQADDGQWRGRVADIKVTS